jgi:hypothetical protein
MSTTQAMSSQVAQWTFDEEAGRIAAFDSAGRLLMVIAASPLFGARLAAAFSSPGPAPLVPGSAESWPTVLKLASGWRPADATSAPRESRAETA